MVKKKGVLIGLALAFFVLPFVVAAAFLLAYQNKIYPQTWAAGVNLAGLTITQAENLLRQRIDSNQLDSIELDYQNQLWVINLSSLELQYDPKQTAEKAYQLSRQGPVKNWFRYKSLGLEFSFKEELLEQQLASIAAQIDQPAIPTQLVFEPQTKIIKAIQGKEGIKLDQARLKRLIVSRLKFLPQDKKIALPVKKLNRLPEEEEIKAAQERAAKLVEKQIVLVSEEQNFILETAQLINFVNFDSWWNQEKISEYVAILAQSVDRPPQNALFKFEKGRVKAFRPHLPGLKLNQTTTVQLIVAALNELINGQERSIKELPLETVEAEIKTSATNRLGIAALLGQGESYFRHSISSRIHNINLASSRLHGLLIAPGEIFSFNQALGEVSRATGYQEAYIIKNGRTILGAGGGVCQVSTTLFRAALNAGLPIVERHPHAYRVSYYEQGAQPGFDATVFAPTTDLKFKNDTSAYILIQRVFEPKNYHLVFQLYGSPDGREVKISNFRLWDIVPPPEDLYIDDPNLPVGTVKQIDWRAWGAKASFDWQVMRQDKVVSQKTFFSHYQPWRAVFLRGTKPN